MSLSHEGPLPTLNWYVWHSHFATDYKLSQDGANPLIRILKRPFILFFLFLIFKAGSAKIFSPCLPPIFLSLLPTNSLVNPTGFAGGRQTVVVRVEGHAGSGVGKQFLPFYRGTSSPASLK